MKRLWRRWLAGLLVAGQGHRPSSVYPWQSTRQHSAEDNKGMRALYLQEGVNMSFHGVHGCGFCFALFKEGLLLLEKLLLPEVKPKVKAALEPTSYAFEVRIAHL